MKKWIVFYALMACLCANAQTNNDAKNDTERLRISSERVVLEDGFKREDTACYKKFWVNNCLDEVKARRSDAMADLRRQEIAINDQERKANAAEQVQKTEDKASPEKQQQDADKRAEALKQNEERSARDKQKNADRVKAELNEKKNLEAATSRAKGSLDKAAGRNAKQAAAAEEVKKYNERLERAKDRQARMASDKAKQAKTPASSLPVPATPSP